jgi:Uncharacterized conserved protein
MRKIIMLLISLILVFSLTDCGHKTDSNGSIPSPQLSPTSDRGNEKTKSTVSTETSSTGGGASVQDARIKLMFGDEEVIVKMYDNPISRDLLAQLPLTLSFKDYAGAEKIAYPPKTLSTKDVPSGADPKLGDLAVYAPWGNLVIYYQDRSYADGVIILGHIDSGIEKLAAMDKEFTVKIERLD